MLQADISTSSYFKANLIYFSPCEKQIELLQPILKAHFTTSAKLKCTLNYCSVLSKQMRLLRPIPKPELTTAAYGESKFDYPQPNSRAQSINSYVSLSSNVVLITSAYSKGTCNFFNQFVTSTGLAVVNELNVGSRNSSAG